MSGYSWVGVASSCVNDDHRYYSHKQLIDSAHHVPARLNKSADMLYHHPFTVVAVERYGPRVDMWYHRPYTAVLAVGWYGSRVVVLSFERVDPESPADVRQCLNVEATSWLRLLGTTSQCTHYSGVLKLSPETLRACTYGIFVTVIKIQLLYGILHHQQT